MKKMSVLLISFLLGGQALASPQLPGFTDNFTVNFPTFNGKPLTFQVYGKSDKHNGLAFQNNGCSTTATGTQCRFSIYDKADSWGDDGNTFVLFTAFPNPVACQFIIYDGTEVTTAGLADYNCTPTSLQPSMTQNDEYDYSINVANNG